MGLKKNLASLLMTGAVSLGTGCNQNPEYHFNGEIGTEKIKFTEDWDDGGNNTLTLERDDGSIIEYIAYWDDFKLSEVRITTANGTSRYFSSSTNPAVKEVIERAQRDFDGYLAKIIEINTAHLDRK